MQILKTDCPTCGATHKVVIQPTMSAQEEARQWNALREQLANAFDAISIARMHVRQGQCNAALMVLNDAMKGK